MHMSDLQHLTYEDVAIAGSQFKSVSHGFGVYVRPSVADPATTRVRTKY